MNEEISLSQTFDLGQPNQDNIFPDNKEPTNTIAMQDALKQYEMNLDFVDVMNKKKEAGILGEIGAGLERFYFGITDIPNNLKDATIRAFNGHIFPNMTEQQATMLMESVTREQMARNQYRQRVEKLEGIDPDNIVSNLTSGIAQAVFYGLTGNVLGGVGMGVSAGVQVAGETSQQYATAYLEKHGTMEGYKGLDDAIYSGLNGAINGYIEQALGVERLFQGTLQKFSIKGAKRQLVESFIEEGAEEYLQEVAGYTVGKTGDYLSNEDYRETRTFGEMQKDALVNAVYGAIIGGAVGAGLYGVNVSRIARNIQSEYGVDNQTAREMAVDTIEQAKDGVLDEVFTDDSLRNAYGESYDLLKEKVKNTILATNTQVFGENLDEYVNLVSKDIAIQVINNAKAFNIPTKDYLDLANVQSFDNILSLERVDLNDVDVVKDLIKTKKAELKELNLKQKTGIDTKAKRDVLNRQVAQLQVIKQKIDKPVSTEQKQSNPVLTEILGNKFNNINLTPQMIALENVAMSEIINNTPELKTDLKGVIPELQVLNKENFNEIINSSSNNNDIKTNAFLYAMTYGSPEQVKDFFVNYSEKVAVNNGNFTERDLVLQAIEESDIGTAEQKKSVLLSETPSVDNTVEKQLLLEYKPSSNQLVDTSKVLTMEQLKETQGTATSGAPENLDVNDIQDYGEKLEGAKKFKDLTNAKEKETLINKITNRTSLIIPYNFIYKPQEFINSLKKANMISEDFTGELNKEKVIKDFFNKLSDEQLDKIRYLNRDMKLDSRGLFLKDDGHFYKVINSDGSYENGYKDITMIDDFINKKMKKSENAGVIKFMYSKSTRGQYYLWGKKGNGSYLPLVRFDNQEEMNKHKESHSQEQLENIYTDMTTFKDTRKDYKIRERVGEDYRQGKNVNEKDFADAFGFRGVQFGNYENQQKRQVEVNNAYDSLKDLAKILNLPEKALSLNGTLGIAFGARGSGSALAHYEQDTKVINITRDAGAGALAHEWFHALDNYLAQNVDSKDANYLTKGANWFLYKGNQELSDAVQNYVWQINSERDLQERLRKLGQYWKRDWEVAARIFEQYVSNKIRNKENINDYLAMPTDYYDISSPYLTIAEQERVFPVLEKMLNAIKTRETEDGNIQLFQENLLPQNVNGFMDTELKTVVLGSNVNQGTLPHEMAHFFLQKNFDLWKQGNPNAQFDELAQQLGITKEQDYLTRDQQEQFAYMTESYIFGKGLASNVSPTVKAYLNWIPAEYESVINMGYKQADGTEYNPIISDEMKKYFDTAYASLGLSTSPTVKAYTNLSDDKDELLASSKEERLVRVKDIQKSIEPEKITMTAQDMVIETKALNKSGETADSWITTLIAGQGTNTREQQQQVASEWVGKNKEEAKRIAFGNHIQTEGDFEQNTAPVDRAFVIREVMKDYSPDSVEYAMLKHKLATYLSLSGKALGLNNDLSFRLYLDNYAKLSNALEQKASFLRYGKSDKSVRLFNADIDKFVATWMDAIVNTKADSQERELAVRNFIESAKQEFETDTILMQEGIFEQLKKANRKNYNDLAKRYVKQMAGALPSNQNIADLMRLSNKAQALSKNIDSNNTEEAITAGKAIRELQNYIRDKGMPESFMQKLIGGWMPRAMLSSPSTHLTNALSNSLQNLIIKGVNRAYYGKNIVSTQVMNNEKARLKSIYENTGFNLAQQYTINDKALIKGERYETTPNAEAKGWKKYDPMKFLGDSDFWFRNNLYIDTLAHIASKNANGDVKEANRLFNEYKQLATIDEKSLEARQEALLVANIGVFTQNGKFAAILSQIRNSLDLVNIDITKRGVDIGVKGNRGLGTMLAPFIKTPANIIELGARAIASPFTTIYTLAKGEKLSISQAIDLGEATTALLTFATLCLAGAKYQGTDDPYDRKNDTIQFGDFAIKLDNFGVMAQPLRQAMTLLGSNFGMQVESKDWLNTGISQLPILSEVEKVKLMKDNIGKFINDFTAEQAGKVIPSIIKPITKKAIGYRPDNKYLRKWTQSLGITQSRSAIDDWTEAVSKVAFGSKFQFE